MLYSSYKKIIENGIYVQGSFKNYTNLSLKKWSNVCYGLSWYRFTYYIKRFEYQKINTKLSTKYSKKHFLFYQITNHYYFTLIPFTYQFSSLKNLNIIKKFASGVNQGRCHQKGKPVHGQRTWSNASNAKYINIYLRYYLHELERTKKSIRLKDQWV